MAQHYPLNDLIADGVRGLDGVRYRIKGLIALMERMAMFEHWNIYDDFQQVPVDGEVVLILSDEYLMTYDPPGTVVFSVTLKELLTDVYEEGYEEYTDLAFEVHYMPRDRRVVEIYVPL